MKAPNQEPANAGVVGQAFPKGKGEGMGKYFAKYHRQYDGAWIYLDSDGLALQNTWFHDPTDGKWYYFDEYCYMLHDTKTPDGHTVGPDGAWIKDGQVVIEAVTNN